MVVGQMVGPCKNLGGLGKPCDKTYIDHFYVRHHSWDRELFYIGNYENSSASHIDIAPRTKSNVSEVGAWIQKNKLVMRAKLFTNLDFSRSHVVHNENPETIR